ncbi:MAG: ABC transporter ATP-binding protein [Rhodospirillaceae bacterium]|jgi:branched-chain amino acid transport system ATP-binding protein|nr:ABC transporter ATP-binding protein [Rhodospirillaceae bacterium]
MSEPLLKVKQLSKSFGGVVATDKLDFDVMPGEIHAVIGPNGAGKTTFVAQIAGMLKSDSGSIVFDGKDIAGKSAPERSHLGLARSFQITSVFRDFTALENVALSIQAHDGHSFRFWKRASTDIELTGPAQKILDDVGLGDKALSLAGNLAHGQQRQLEIAMALATSPKMLLLDEPTAGMGTEESENMRQFLSNLKSDYSMLLIEHDMDTVFSLADRVTVLVYGRGIATGTPEEIRNNAEVRAAYLGEDE